MPSSYARGNVSPERAIYHNPNRRVASSVRSKNCATKRHWVLLRTTPQRQQRPTKEITIDRKRVVHTSVTHWLSGPQKKKILLFRVLFLLLPYCSAESHAQGSSRNINCVFGGKFLKSFFFCFHTLLVAHPQPTQRQTDRPATNAGGLMAMILCVDETFHFSCVLPGWLAISSFVSDAYSFTTNASWATNLDHTAFVCFHLIFASPERWVATHKMNGCRTACVIGLVCMRTSSTKIGL